MTETRSERTGRLATRMPIPIRLPWVALDNITPLLDTVEILSYSARWTLSLSFSEFFQELGLLFFSDFAFSKLELKISARWRRW